jgi:hypothetical protein
MASLQTNMDDTSEVFADAPKKLSDLPSPNTKRWVIRRKAAVVYAVHSGLLTLEQACDRYKLSSEEFDSWRRLIDAHGVRGLRSTRLQQYRDPKPR